METILIQNFGPIINASIKINDINIFIGTTSSGKSTVAKLISIFRSSSLDANTTYKQFKKFLENYNIDFSINNNSLIRYSWDDFFCEIKKDKISSNYSTGKNHPVFNPIYIPAERIFFPTIAQSIFGLISSNVSLPKWFLDFGAEFERARKSIKNLAIEFLNVSYEFDDTADFVKLENNTRVRLSQASSGLQSVIPLILVVLNTANSELGTKDMLVIEEPELNLYPSSQKALIEFIIKCVNSSNDKLIVTTHSPYLLTALDNLIQAKNVVQVNPESKEKVTELVGVDKWLDFHRVSCYFFNNGGCFSTMDEEMKSIGPSNIDDVSVELSDTFEKLLVLKYPS